MVPRDNAPIQVVSCVFFIGGIMSNIEQQLAELSQTTLEKLKESEQKYRNIFENVQDVFYQMDLTGKIIDISPSVQSFTGYERDQMLGQSLFDLLFTPVDKNKFMTRLLKFGTLTDFEFEMMSKKSVKKYRK